MAGLEHPPSGGRVRKSLYSNKLCQLARRLLVIIVANDLLQSSPNQTPLLRGVGQLARNDIPPWRGVRCESGKVYPIGWDGPPSKA
jgi:hypothetical protein